MEHLLPRIYILFMTNENICKHLVIKSNKTASQSATTKTSVNIQKSNILNFTEIVTSSEH